MDDLLVEQGIGLVDEAQRDIRYYLCRSSVRESTVVFVGLFFAASEFADEERFFGVLFLNRMIASAQEILVVDEKFFETGSRDICELELYFGRGLGGFAAFRDILLPGAGGLYHLVDGAVSSTEKTLAETIGKIVDDFRFSIGKQLGVVAGLGQEVRRVRTHGNSRSWGWGNRSYESYRTYD